MPKSVIAYCYDTKRKEVDVQLKRKEGRTVDRTRLEKGELRESNKGRGREKESVIR